MPVDWSPVDPIPVDRENETAQCQLLSILVLGNKWSPPNPCNDREKTSDMLIIGENTGVACTKKIECADF